MGALYGYFFEGGPPWWWRHRPLRRLFEPRLRRRLKRRLSVRR
jgi:hypothetical protein